MTRRFLLVVALAFTASSPAHSAGQTNLPTEARPVWERLEGLRVAQGRRTCKSVSSCREAVILWCQEGYRRADGDSDGIPCETVCSTVAEVEEIMSEVGC